MSRPVDEFGPRPILSVRRLAQELLDHGALLNLRTRRLVLDIQAVRGVSKVTAFRAIGLARRLSAQSPLHPIAAGCTNKTPRNVGTSGAQNRDRSPIGHEGLSASLHQSGAESTPNQRSTPVKAHDSYGVAGCPPARKDRMTRRPESRGESQAKGQIPGLVDSRASDGLPGWRTVPVNSAIRVEHEGTHHTMPWAVPKAL